MKQRGKLRGKDYLGGGRRGEENQIIHRDGHRQNEVGEGGGKHEVGFTEEGNRFYDGLHC